MLPFFKHGCALSEDAESTHFAEKPSHESNYRPKHAILKIVISRAA